MVTALPEQEQDLEALAGWRGVPITKLGTTGGARLRFGGLFDVDLADAITAYEGALPKLMSGQ